MKKMLALLMTLVMVLGMMPTAWAAEENILSAGTHTLTEDWTLSSGYVIAEDTEVIIDLAGHTLSYASSEEANNAAITNKGTLTIKDSVGGGKITYQSSVPSTAYGTNAISNQGGTLTVEGGTIENTTTGGASYAIDNNNSLGDAITTINGGTITATHVIRLVAFNATAVNKVVVNNGSITGKRAVWIQLPGSDKASAPNVTLDINGGTLTSNNELAIYSYSYGNAYNGVNIDISGGTFTGAVAVGGGFSTYAATGCETLNVSGGTFLRNSYNEGYDCIWTYTNEDNVTVTGGTFAVDPSWCVPEGYVVVAEGSNYVVKSFADAAVAKIGANYYLTLAEAVEAAADGNTIVILANNTEAAVTLPVGVKLDTNGKTLTNAPLAPTNCVTILANGVWSVNEIPAEVAPAEGTAEVAPAIPAVTVDEEKIDTEAKQTVVAELTTAGTATTATVPAGVLEDAAVADRIAAIMTDNSTAKVVAVPVVEKEITDVEVDADNVATKVTFDVNAELILLVNGTKNGDAIDLKDSKQLITFTLPVPGDWNGQVVYIVHESSSGNVYQSAVAANNLVTVTTNKGFSPFVLSTEKPADYPSYGGGGGSYVPSGHQFTTTLQGINKVTVGGNVVDSKYYTIVGTNVILSQEYIDSLKAGSYKVVIENATHIATGTLKVGDNKVQSAKTFDAGIALYAGMALTSAFGAAYVSKKKH